MKTDIFNLQIIAIKDILAHEEYDEKRALPLITRLKDEKYLANPILVAPLNGGKFLQLDGMNRLSAFKLMGLKSILAQIIEYEDQDKVELSSWLHLIKGDVNQFLDFVKTEAECNVKKGNIFSVGHKYIKEEGLGRICTIVSRKCKVFDVYSNESLGSKVMKLNKMVSFYKTRIIRDVLPANPDGQSVKMVFASHTESDFMVIFPTFTRHQIIEVVKQKLLFPPGITRHIIKRRCLNFNIPVSHFDPKISLEGQNKKLEEMLQRRAFRVYEESTVYFE